jgi:hypothetical protein
MMCREIVFSICRRGRLGIVLWDCFVGSWSMERTPLPSCSRRFRMEKWACGKVRWEVLGRKGANLVVDLAPCLILDVAVLKSLQTVDANVQICGEEYCDWKE